MMGVKRTFSQHWMERVKFQRGKETSIQLFSISLPQIVLLTLQLQIQRGQGKTRCGEREDSLQPPLPGQKPKTGPHLARMPSREEPSKGSARLRSRRAWEVRGSSPAGPQPTQPDFSLPAASIGSGAELGAARRRGHPLLNGFSGVLRGMGNGSPPS